MEVQTPPAAPPYWSNILKQQPVRREPQPPPPQNLKHFVPGQNGGVLVGSCKSSKRIAVAVVDANAITKGGKKLFHTAYHFVLVTEVITEIRNPASRHSHSRAFPRCPKKVISFAKATGDLQNFLDVDMKLIALTYAIWDNVKRLYAIKLESISQGMVLDATPGKVRAGGDGDDHPAELIS